MSNQQTCRSCGAPVLWRKHQRTGKPAPIDAEPNPDGNVVLLGEERYYVLSPKERETWTSRVEGSLHTNHFQTCPQQKLWSRKVEVQP